VGKSRTGLKRALPYAGTLLIFALIFWRIPVGNVAAALAQVPILTFVAVFIPFCIAYWMIDSICLTWVVKHFNSPIHLRDVMPVRASMYLLALVNSNLGQGGVAWYLHRKTGVRFVEMLGSILFIGLMEIYQLSFFSTLGVAFYHPASSAQARIVGILRVVYIIAWILLIVIVGFFAHARHNARISDLVQGSRFAAIAATFIKAKPLDYAIVLGIKAPGFLLSVITQYYALSLFGIAIPLVKLFLFLPLVFLAAALPVSVAHLGTSQAAWLLFFSGSGPDAKILAYSLAAHFTFMFCNGLIGLMYLPRASRELMSVDSPDAK